MTLIGQVMGAKIFADTEDEHRAKRIGQVMADFFVAAKDENVPMCVPPHAYCGDCGDFVAWFFNQDEICCEPAHHIIAVFGAKRSEAAS